jgi:hypothetical protein
MFAAPVNVPAAHPPTFTTVAASSPEAIRS